MPDNPAMLMPGQSGTDLLTGAATSALPDQAAIQQQAQNLIQQLVQQRMGSAGGDITFGPELARPIVPSPPQPTPGGGIPQGSFGSVGERKRADKQALFGTIADIVRGAEKKHYQMDVQKLQHDFEIMSGAIKGYNEAQASGNKEMMKHNADIINGIVSDPKKAKALAKAFEVDLNPLAEKKKKEKPNPAQDALKAAFAKDTQDFAAKKTMLAPQAQALMRQVPQTAQMDPRLAIIEQLTKSGVLPKAGEELTFTKDLMQINQRAAANKLTNDDKMNMAKMMVDAKDRNTQAAVLRTLMTVQGANDRMQIMERMWKYRADKVLEGVNNRVQQLRERFKPTAGNIEDKKLGTLIKSLDSQAKAIKEQVTAAAKAHDNNALKALNNQLSLLEMQQKIVSAEAAKRVGLDENDFNQDPLKLDDNEIQQMLQLFQSGEDDAATTADQQ
jgi:hypothetical protein